MTTLRKSWKDFVPENQPVIPLPDIPSFAGHCHLPTPKWSAPLPKLSRFQHEMVGKLVTVLHHTRFKGYNAYVVDVRGDNLKLNCFAENVKWEIYVSLNNVLFIE